MDGIAEAASVAGTIARSDTEVGLRTTVSAAAATRNSTTTGEAAPSWSAAHWAHLAATAGEHGVHIEAGDPAALPHHVEVSQNIRARVDRSAT